MSAVLDNHGHAGDHARRPRPSPCTYRLAPLGVRHQPQRHRHALSAVLVHHADGGRVLALLIRAELFSLVCNLVNPELFNQLTTMHGLIMVFGAIMPAFVGFNELDDATANWRFVGHGLRSHEQLQLLADDSCAIMLVASFFMPGGAPAAGWTFVCTADAADGPSMDAGIFAMHILGASSIMGSINIIVTILNMRAPRHDADEDAHVRLDLADHRLSADRCDARAGWRDHHDADRPPLRHQLLQPAGGGDPVMCTSTFLVLRSP